MKIIETNWKWKNGLSTRSATTDIVLHHAAAVTCTAQQIDQWHKGNGWSGIGYHFFIRKDGSIYRGRPENSVGAHASGKNSTTIGVCVEGNYETEPVMPAAQKTALKELLTYLKGKYPKAGLKAHKEVGATGCPGKNYPLAEMKSFWNNPTTTKTESEDEPMTKEERTKFNELVNTVSALQKKVDKIETPMIYNYIDKNMPDSYKPTIQKLVNKGYLKGNEKGLMLTEDMMRICTILDRAGAFDN